MSKTQTRKVIKKFQQKILKNSKKKSKIHLKKCQQKKIVNKVVSCARSFKYTHMYITA